MDSACQVIHALCQRPVPALLLQNDLGELQNLLDFLLIDRVTQRPDLDLTAEGAEKQQLIETCVLLAVGTLNVSFTCSLSISNFLI
jgi:hypothetical protein